MIEIDEYPNFTIADCRLTIDDCRLSISAPVSRPSIIDERRLPVVDSLFPMPKAVFQSRIGNRPLSIRN
jgi:hypothetical protein